MSTTWYTSTLTPAGNEQLRSTKPGAVVVASTRRVIVTGQVTGLPPPIGRSWSDRFAGWMRLTSPNEPSAASVTRPVNVIAGAAPRTVATACGLFCVRRTVAVSGATVTVNDEVPQAFDGSHALTVTG